MQMIRTTITLPEDLYRQLKAAAFYKEMTFSELIREGANSILKGKKTIKTGGSIEELVGKYSIKGKMKWKDFNRQEFYDEIIRHKMSFGH